MTTVESLIAVLDKYDVNWRGNRLADDLLNLIHEERSAAINNVLESLRDT